MTQHPATSDQSPTTSYYTYDANGNVTGLIDSADGSMQNSYDYDAFGRLVASTETVRNPFTFSTKYEDTETGLFYYGYRYYSSVMGRWLNRDPIEEDGGINIYGMIGNDAVNKVDVLGLDTFEYSHNGGDMLLVRKYTYKFKFYHRYKGYSVKNKAQITQSRNRSGRVLDCWTRERKRAFKKSFEGVIENIWNNHNFRITNNKGGFQNSYVPRLDLVKKRGSVDWVVHVLANRRKKFITSSNPISGGNAYLDEGDLKPVHKKKSAAGVKQVSAAHEFGHELGLHHPGHNVKVRRRVRGRIRLVDADPYAHRGKNRHHYKVDGPRDLMGAGNDIRAYYFNTWVKYLQKTERESIVERWSIQE